MSNNVVKFSKAGKTAIIRLNRPEVHNSINDAVMRRLETILNILEGDDNIGSVIITGAGEESFCSGGDLRYFAALKTTNEVRKMSIRMQNILTRFWEGDKPVIAAVNGQAFGGGCEILSYCHIRIAASHAQFGFRHAANGVITGWGGGKRILKQLGRAAVPLLLTAKKISATDALRINFIDIVVEAGKLLDEALDWAGKINNNPAAAVQKFLQLSRLVLSGIDEQISRFEAESFVELWKKEAFQNILKKYQP